jgi:hypothetical protein
MLFQRYAPYEGVWFYFSTKMSGPKPLRRKQRSCDILVKDLHRATNSRVAVKFLLQFFPFNRDFYKVIAPSKILMPNLAF